MYEKIKLDRSRQIKFNWISNNRIYVMTKIVVKNYTIMRSLITVLELIDNSQKTISFFTMCIKVFFFFLDKLSSKSIWNGLERIIRPEG